MLPQFTTGLMRSCHAVFALVIIQSCGGAFGAIKNSPFEAHQGSPLSLLPDDSEQANVLIPYQLRRVERDLRVSLRRLDELGITYEVRHYEYEFAESTPLAQDRIFLEFHLGQLTEAHFRAVKAAYPFPNNTLTYTPGRDYLLRDFLPDPARALINKRFKGPTERAGADRAQDSTRLPSLRMETNCWATAYEFARASPGIWTTWVDPGAAGKSFFDFFFSNEGSLVQRIASEAEIRFGTAMGAAIQSGQFRLQPPEPNSGESFDNRQFYRDQLRSLIASGVLPPVPNATANPDLKVGDLLLIPVDHAAVYIDEGVYFERPALGDKNEGGFRFVTFRDLAVKYNEDVFPRLAHYRVREQLPDPAQAFTYGSDFGPHPRDGQAIETQILKLAYDRFGTPFLTEP